MNHHVLKQGRTNSTCMGSDTKTGQDGNGRRKRNSLQTTRESVGTVATPPVKEPSSILFRREAAATDRGLFGTEAFRKLRSGSSGGHRPGRVLTWGSHLGSHYHPRMPTDFNCSY